MTTTLWLTGLPSSGKSTLGRALAERYRPHRAVEHLDGDQLRRDLFPELGYGKADRMENIRRIGRLATMLAAHDVLVIASVIAPYSESRAEVRSEHEARGLNFVEVHVHAPVEVCASRDVKGLYASARRGEITGLTGYGDNYEVPDSPDVRVDTSTMSVDGCLSAIDDALNRAERFGREVA
ncbi:MAG TPA: adenylyl-sulfate kinase [Actinophytocola sp.]|uniref:adenylyl-sulfate kinase n=1 Tax=Actinophytocola sp. TaxID=1872138 RepID=UPI002DDD76F6|nr:adenylyl-sulfate kinase [Actinophytocola sp.]HEV2783354.1 adenylyl-sulfate kinase [Actinophytocola sp.]